MTSQPAGTFQLDQRHQHLVLPAILRSSVAILFLQVVLFLFLAVALEEKCLGLSSELYSAACPQCIGI